MSQQDEFRRTIGYGEAAISHLKQDEVPAYPRNYELWYTYFAGYNHALNKAVNDILKTSGQISADEIFTIYNEYLAPTRLNDRIDEVGGQIAAEINAVAEQIESAASTTSSYCSTLTRASNDLLRTADKNQLLTIIGNLVTVTQVTERTNRQLEAKLAVSRKHITEIQDKIDAIRHESLTDELTKLSNRKHFNQSIERAVVQAREKGEIFSLLLTDIDHFKNFNDTYGHQTGDQVLRLVGMTVKQKIKGEDIACRYGGEEFGIILPGTPLERAVPLAAQIRLAVMAKELVKRPTGESLGNITISIGVSSFKANDTVQSIIERADHALYLAKRTGRNKVCTEKDLEIAPHKKSAEKVA